MKRLEALFHAALKLPPGERERFLAAECGSNRPLLEEVRSLLAHAHGPTAELGAIVAEAAGEVERQARLAPGTMIGTYRLEKEIGAGGMGTVYEAFDVQLERRVAVKCLRPGAKGLSEARAAAALSHPNIAVVHEFGEFGGAPWIAMEYIDGVSLRARLRAGGLAHEVWIRYALQLADALAHAHSRGVVHRDVKPENLLLLADGTLKLIDFGISNDSASGWGTPAYAAPERDPSPASDVYGAGMVIYEMARGRRPGAEMAPGDALGRLVARCLATEPAARYRDGGALRAALRELESKEGYGVEVFRNLSAAPEFDWLGTGLADTLRTRLAKQPDIRVRLRPAQARWLVTGSFQQSGGIVRVSVCLTDTLTGEVRVAESLDGAWAELFALQDRIAARVVAGCVSQPEPTMPHTRSVGAFEQYSRGRAALNRMDPAFLSEGIQHLEQALALDPEYALACSALGTACALRFIRTSDPDDVRRAHSYLERAIVLDAELGEPYPWLANMRLRANDVKGARAAGEKGVALQPDLPMAHYFHGGLHYMNAECGYGPLEEGVTRLREAVRLEPRLHAARLMWGTALCFGGSHAAAVAVLEEAIRMESREDLVYRFVGAAAMRGICWMRSGEWSRAASGFEAAQESLRHGPDHHYREFFVALTACCQGELALRSGDTETAQRHLRYASRIVKESPRVVGGARLWIRIAAAAAAAETDLDKARGLYADAVAGLEGPAAQPAAATIECGLAQLELCAAVAALRLGERAAANGHLARARAAHWRDAGWLRADPMLRPLRDEPVFLEFVRALEQMPPVPVEPLNGQAELLG